MARKDRLPATRPCKHAPGNPVCLSSGDAWCGGRCGHTNRIWNRLLVGGQTSGSHGRSWPASAVSSRLVTGHYFLFPGAVLFLQNAHVEIKSPTNKTPGNGCPYRTSSNALGQ